MDVDEDEAETDEETRATHGACRLAAEAAQHTNGVTEGWLSNHKTSPKTVTD